MGSVGDDAARHRVIAYDVAALAALARANPGAHAARRHWSALIAQLADEARHAADAYAAEVRARIAAWHRPPGTPAGLPAYPRGVPGVPQGSI